MNQSHNVNPGELCHTGFFVLRTPLLPLEMFTDWPIGAAGAPEAHDKSSSDGLPTDRHIQQMLRRSDVKEALLIASPSLHDRWYEPEATDRERVDRKLTLAVSKYLVRMATRCTPFGLCAGVSTGDIGQRTHIQIAPSSQFQRTTRLDFRFLEAIAERVAEQSQEMHHRVFVPNDTWYRVGEYIRYQRWRTTSTGRQYQAVTVQCSNELMCVLLMAGGGATAEQLCEKLLKRFPGSDLEMAQQLVMSAVKARLLLPDGALLPITGVEASERLANTLCSNAATELKGRALDAARTALSELDKRGITGDKAPYTSIRRQLAPLEADAAAPALFKLDLVKPLAHGELASATVDSILKGIAACQKLLRPGEHAQARQLKELVKRFERRFGERDVPLPLALDDACAGLFPRAESHASTLLDHIAIGTHPLPEDMRWGTLDDFLMARLLARTSQCAEIEVKPEDAAALQVRAASLPRSFAAFVSLLPQDEILLHGIGGACGVGAATRFCYTDPSLEAKVRAHLGEESRASGDCIIAEVVHVPSTTGSTENVLLRPVLRDYEITYAACSGIAADRQIRISDLWLSVREGRFVLRSERLGREVIPRLSTAHNYASSKSLPVYRFLGLLQHQESYWHSFDWGVAFDKLPYLPRVRMGRLILSLARWRIESRVWSAGRRLAAAKRSRWLEQLTTDYRLPRFVSFGGPEHVLSVDLQNPTSVDMLLASLDPSADAVLSEMPQLQGPSPVRGEAGTYCNEVLIPVIRKTVSGANGIRSSPARRSVPLNPSLTSREHWLYVKLYCGVGWSERILSDALSTVIDESTDDGTVSHWFFVRYHDPDFHLRLRFCGRNRAALLGLFNRMSTRLEQLAQHELLARIQLDSYQPEVWRYGGAEALRICERLFWLDSSTVLNVLPTLLRDPSGDARWRLAYLTMDQILASFNLGDEWSRDVVGFLARQLASELQCTSQTKGQLSAQFREHKDLLLASRTGDLHGPDTLAECVRVLRSKYVQYSQEVSNLRKVFGSADRDSCAKVVSSLLHMHANRIFLSRNRETELILYDFLERAYRSSVARKAPGKLRNHT